MRVYVAGPYSAGDIITSLNHMRKGMRASAEILLAGHEPFCPWVDFHFQLMLREGEDLKVEDYYRYSIAWLEVSDVMIVLDGWNKSKGTLTEMKRARKLEIPIYHGVGAFFAAMKIKLDTNDSIFQPERKFWKKKKRSYPHPVKSHKHYEEEPDNHITNGEKIDDRLI
jgi:hypothetical protein